MGIEENKAAVEKFHKGLNEEDASLINELITDDFVLHAMGTDRDLGKEYITQFNTRTYLSDFGATVEDMVAEGDKVAVRATMKGTQTGQFGNIAPTGKTISIPRFLFFRFEGSKITEVWNLNDRLGMFQQLGALPPTEEIGK